MYCGAAPKTKVGGHWRVDTGLIQSDYINKHYGIGQEVVTVCVKKPAYPLGEISTLEPRKLFWIIDGIKAVAVIQYSETVDMKVEDIDG